MTVGDSEKNRQREHDEQSRTPEHFQTLPLITEEIVTSHPTPAAEPTVRVMPPNPIRRDSEASQQPTTAGPEARAGAPSPASPTVVSPTAVSPAAVAEAAETAEDKTAEKKSSEGRISATQLLAGAGAAATSSVIGGQLGVAGTVVGAGVASIITGLAVTLYSRSLDKGKEKIQEVGSKLAPAVKAKIAKAPAAGASHVDASLAEDSAFAPPEPAGIDATRSTTSAMDDDNAPSSTGEDSAPDSTEDEPQSWWKKLRRKRVLYPLTIGVAAFGIGLGAVVVAENFTDADISPGTSQISRSVTGKSAPNDDAGTSDGNSHSGTSGDESSNGSGADGSQGSSNNGTNAQNGQSTSAGETGTQGTAEGQSSQGTDTTTGTSDASGASTTSDGTDASSGSTSTDSTGGADGGVSGSAGSGSDGSSGSGSGSGGSSAGAGGSGTGGSGGESAASAQG